MADKHPRVIALAVIRRDDSILVSEITDLSDGRIFYRPLGGAVEFGERAADAVVRELDEELGAAVVVTKYLSTVENIFTYMGEPGHEIVLLYETRFRDETLYHAEKFPRIDATPAERVAVWKPLAFFAAGCAPLYPDGLLDILRCS